MGIKDYLKKKGESKAKNYREDLEYRNKVKEAIKQERRKAFLTQAIISSRASATAKAKRVYNPPATSSGFGNTSPMFNQLMGIEKPQQQKQIVRREIIRTKRKGKKIGRRKKQQVRRFIRQEVKPVTPTNQFDIWKL